MSVKCHFFGEKAYLGLITYKKSQPNCVIAKTLKEEILPEGFM